MKEQESPVTANGAPSGGTSTVVYLVRHGITDWNRERRFQGQLDIPLSEEGIEQAESVANWFAAQDRNFVGLYSSDLKRARQTASTIGRRLHIVPVFYRDFREIHVGDWQGLRYDEVNERYPGQLEEWHNRIDTYTLPGGESVTIVQQRMNALFQRLLEKHAGEAFIVVSHGMALAALQAAIHGWDLVETFRTSRARLGNTGVTAVSIDSVTEGREILFHNSAVHLESPTGMTSLSEKIA